MVGKGEKPMRAILHLSISALLAAAPAIAADKVPSVGSSPGKGYLQAPALPDSAEWAPAPPAAGTPAQLRDRAGAEAGVALRGSPRW